MGVVVADDVAEAGCVAVAAVQRSLALVGGVEVGDEAAYPGVVGYVVERPIDHPLVGPLRHCAQLAAHEQQLLAWLGPHRSVQQAQVGEALPLVAGHLVEQRALAVDHLVVRERQDVALGEGVHAAERELVVVVAAVHWFTTEVLQRIVHPAHVPLEAEPEPAIGGRPRDVGPSRRFLGERRRVGELLGDRRGALLEEVDGREVLPPAVTVGDPLALVA